MRCGEALELCAGHLEGMASPVHAELPEGVRLFGMTALRLLVEVLRTPEFCAGAYGGESTYPEARASYEAFFVPETVARLTKTVVFKFLTLRMADLEEWESDPEGFYSTVNSGDWHVGLRPCAEVACKGCQRTTREAGALAASG